jgi:hypothetical protein
MMWLTREQSDVIRPALAPSEPRRFTVEPTEENAYLKTDDGWKWHVWFPTAADRDAFVAEFNAPRLTRPADLPEGIRSYVEKEAPLWKAPPVDLAEIARLQKGQ